MVRDALGNALSDGDAAAVAAADDFVLGFLRYETRAARIIAAAAAQPDSPLLNGYAAALFMLLESPEGPGRAAPFLVRAEAAAHLANPREAGLIRAIRAWADDDEPAAVGHLRGVASEFPRDLAAVKLAQYLVFNRGDAAAMLRLGLDARTACPDVPQAHGMAAFAFEQSHRLDLAEAAARKALEMSEREPWAQHALAHVMITQGRIDEGADFMRAAAPTWTDLNSFMVTHNWWHLGLFELSRGRVETVLELYDQQCWAYDRSYSQDQIGAVSLLARLELAGAEVGDRWTDVADHVAARGADVTEPFLSLHYLYALRRTGRAEAEALMTAFRVRAQTAPPASRRAWAEVALPVAEGIDAFHAGRPEIAARRIEAALPRLSEIGGSHAQRDLFEQIRLVALTAAGEWVAVQQALELRRPFEPNGWALNRDLARAYSSLNLPELAAEALGRIAARA